MGSLYFNTVTMTAAEKIRQVVEETINELWSDFERIETRPEVAYHIYNNAVLLLDIIHNELKEAVDYYEDNDGFHKIYAIQENLEEARSSLDSGCTSITNSTHE